MLADGWYRVAFRGGPYVEIWKVENGADVANAEYIESWLGMGYTFEPVVILAAEEHAALVRDADMWRRLKELPTLILRTGED